MDNVTFLENEIKSLLSLGEHHGIPIPWCISDVDDIVIGDGDECSKIHSLRRLHDGVTFYLTSREFPNRVDEPFISVSNLTEADIEVVY